MTFDAARGVVVLFGGETASGLLNDTWEWNGAVWFSRSPATAPPARAEHAIAWDAMRQQTVLFGGRGAGGLLADTWVWNGTTWSQRSGTAPAPRCRHTLTWHGTRQALTLFAGIDSVGTFDDLWEWNGTAWSSLAAPGLGGRSSHFAAWDPTGRRLIVGGGRSSTDVWAWSGSAWSALPSLGQPLAAAALACSSSRCVLHGGIAGTSPFVAPTPLTRKLDASAWTTIFTSPALEGTTATFDSTRGRVVAAGASGLFEWTGSSWEQELTSVPAELARYDAPRGVTVIYAGSGNGAAARTTRWNGFTATITTTDPTPGRLGQAAAYNPATSAVMLFGGARPPISADPVLRSYSDLWQWTGTAWTSVGNIGVSPGRSEAALAYDPIRNQVVVFGGITTTGSFLGDTWVWNGTLSPASLVTGTSPPARSQAAITWDPDAQRVVLYGGRASLGVAYADLWAWDGSTWSPIASDRTAGRAGQLEYDVANHRLIHFNGSGELWYRPRD
ncbi:MAG: hypothetical protein JNM69_35670 [Archangium sp.]|nr:hypothetical protein [Archangium sp.]